MRCSPGSVRFAPVGSQQRSMSGPSSEASSPGAKLAGCSTDGSKWSFA